MKKAIILTLAATLSGCATTGEDPKTIAGGAEGQIDYCIDLAVIEPICINAKRTLGEPEGTDE